MPTIRQFTHALKICMYGDDHLPPHFHIVSPDQECIAGLSDLRVIEGQYRKGDLFTALAWATENIVRLERSWSELNERD